MSFSNIQFNQIICFKNQVVLALLEFGIPIERGLLHTGIKLESGFTNAGNKAAVAIERAGDHVTGRLQHVIKSSVTEITQEVRNVGIAQIDAVKNTLWPRNHSLRDRIHFFKYSSVCVSTIVRFKCRSIGQSHL